MFAQAIEDILKDRCTADAIRLIEAGGPPLALWDAIADAGFLELLAPESDGGAGLPLAELFPVLVILGRYAMPVPIAQSMAARALLAGHTQVPQGPVTLASACHHTDDGHLVCAITPFGLLADHVLTNDAGSLLLLPCAGAERASTGVHGSLAATLKWQADTQKVAIPDRGAVLPAYAAALHAALMSGAMSRILEMTLQYANDRSQFGKSIGKFQAIQHQISVMAEHVAAAAVAAEAAFSHDGDLPPLLPAAIAKARTSEATVTVASVAHAVHGAIGVTAEYDLQLLTRRLHEWRVAHGSETYWNMVVGRSVMACPLPGVIDFLRSVGAPAEHQHSPADLQDCQA